MSASTLTIYGRQQMLIAVFAPDAYAGPTDLHFTLTLTPATTNTDGSELDEPDPSYGFARQAYPLGATSWSPTGFGEVFNAAAIEFPTIITDSGLAQGWALCDDPEIGAGNVWAVGEIAEPYELVVGLTPLLDVGDVTLGLYD